MNNRFIFPFQDRSKNKLFKTFLFFQIDFHINYIPFSLAFRESEFLLKVYQIQKYKIISQCSAPTVVVSMSYDNSNCQCNFAYVDEYDLIAY